jgi:NAD(P)H-flavin reductase
MSSYLPIPAKVLKVKPLTSDINHFTLETDKPLNYGPGQFVMTTMFGVGESAISITSAPRTDNYLEMAVRKVGSVTNVLYNAKPGDSIGLRGPFGKGFNIDNFLGKDVLFVCGGLGLVPLKSFIEPVIERHSEFGSINIIAGAQKPSLFLYPEELTEWEKKDNVTVHRLVDSASGEKWMYEEGLVTAAIPNLNLNPEKTLCALCGPPVMYKFVIIELEKKNIPSENIFVDLERRMNCGIGVCGHCQIQDMYVCKEGPVFNYGAIKNKEEAF